MNPKLAEYLSFNAAKRPTASTGGLHCEPSECNPILKPHQRDIVAWAVQGKQRAVFTAFGLGKTMMNLEIARLTLEKIGGSKWLVVMPLAVRHEFANDAAQLGLTVTFVRRQEEVTGPGIYLTNYESVRDGRINPLTFDGCSLDEAAILRGLGGTKTFREFMNLFEHTDIPRFAFTATPSPNDFIELLAYSAFLGIMDVGQAKTRFFKRDSEKADNLTIHPHKRQEFWLWVATWAMFLQRPSDLGYSDEGYELPPLEVVWHELPTDHSEGGAVLKSGQISMMVDASASVSASARERRKSLPMRIDKALEIRNESKGDHFVYWHDLEDERRALEAAIPGIVTVYGSQDEGEQESAIVGFRDGKIRELGGKPCMLGAGVNFQRHCHRAIYLGIGYKFADFIQSVHRLQRFQQTQPVRIDLIYTEAERGIRAVLERKWAQHIELVGEMTRIIREYGLATSAIEQTMTRAMGVERKEESSESFRLINNDSVIETMSMPESSVGLILTSIPFGTQYEYSPNYLDFGHTDDNEHFWRQMDYLSPELLRVLIPGRVMAVHVKDRITPSGINGRGYQTVAPFHAEAIYHYTRHGFGYLGMVTIETDVVRENAQTYRLGWTEQCKDGTKQGVGMPEYLLLFRKDPTDASNGYGDVPVMKDKSKYSRGRWQFDADGFWRSSGDRLLTGEDFAGMTHAQIFQAFKAFSANSVYSHESVVALADHADAKGMLPTGFKLLQLEAQSPHIWTDITRMRTLNMLQALKGREGHLCPMQFDIADRVINRLSMPGETVFDPFAGIGTVPRQAVLAGRFGLGCELSPVYFGESVLHCKAAEQQLKAPSLFDLIEEVAGSNELEAVACA